MKNFDLAIAYRIYPKISKTPFVYPSDKLQLARLGVKSFRESLSGLTFKVFFILDNCPENYERMILEFFDEKDVEFIRYNGVGNLATFGIQMDLLLKQTYSENLFFMEDDYLFRPSVVLKALNFLKQDQVSFVTPYDHIDNYTMDIHQQHKYKIVVYEDYHWRTTASTCMTFLTKKKALIETENVFRSYCNGNWDSSLWFALTKHNVFKLNSLAYIFTNRMLFKSVLLSWIKTWPQILLGKRFDLWLPIPSFATHMESTGLAPVVNWQDIKTSLD